MTNAHLRASAKLASLAILVFILSVTACANLHVYRDVTVDEVAKGPTFVATVEKIVVEKRLFFKPDIYIYMRVPSSGERLALTIISADELELGFSKYLRKGESYTFPKIITDYLSSQK